MESSIHALYSIQLVLEYCKQEDADKSDPMQSRVKARIKAFSGPENQVVGSMN